MLKKVSPFRFRRARRSMLTASMSDLTKSATRTRRRRRKARGSWHRVSNKPRQLPPAQTNYGTLQMSQVGNDGARAGLDQLLAERGARMTGADKANNRHTCRRGSSHTSM